MYLRIIASPGARKERVEEKGEDVLLIAVKEPAEGNRANKRIREIVAARYTVSVGKVLILTGHHSRSKMVRIDI